MGLSPKSQSPGDPDRCHRKVGYSVHPLTALWLPPWANQPPGPEWGDPGTKLLAIDRISPGAMGAGGEHSRGPVFLRSATPTHGHAVREWQAQ